MKSFLIPFFPFLALQAKLRFSQSRARRGIKARVNEIISANGVELFFVILLSILEREMLRLAVPLVLKKRDVRESDMVILKKRGRKSGEGIKHSMIFFHKNKSVFFNFMKARVMFTA